MRSIQKPLGAVAQKNLFMPQNRVKNQPVFFQSPNLSDTFQKQPLTTPVFAGKQKTSKSAFQKGVIWLTMALGAISGPLTPPLQSTALGHSVHTQTSPLSLVAIPQETTNYKLTKADKERYENIESWFPYLESLPVTSSKRSEGLAKLQGYWSTLRNDAVNGDQGSRVILDAIWVNRMFDEVAHPNPNAIRFNDDKFNTLSNQFKNGQLSREDFNTKVQKRALLGLYAYYKSNHFQNEFTQNTQRFFQPISKLLAENSDGDIQKWGSTLLGSCFTSFTPQQQSQHLQNVSTQLLSSEGGPSKLSALRTLHSIYVKNKTLPFWDTLIPKVQTQLEALKTNPDPQKQEELKYPIVLLGVLKDSELTTLVEPLLKADATPNTQRAIAWALGSVKSPKGLKHLTQIIENNEFHPLAREMGVYSLGEYATGYKEHVFKTLTSSSKADATTTPQNVIEAAQIMLEKLKDKSITEPDFFIHKLLKTDPEKAKYQKLRDQYIIGREKLNTAQKNMIDQFLLPYRDFLSEIIRRGGKHQIITGTVTDISEYKHLIGIRIADGRLEQSIQGMSSSYGGATTNKNRIVPNSDNTFAHETTHHIHQLVLNNRNGMSSKIVNMYQKALKEKRLMDYYSATNDHEYFAQAGEAMVTPYKSHSQLYEGLFNNGYDTGHDNTQSKLKRMDPKLYEFLKSLQAISDALNLNILKIHSPRLYAQVLKTTKQTNQINIA